MSTRTFTVETEVEVQVDIWEIIEYMSRKEQLDLLNELAKHFSLVVTDSLPGKDQVWFDRLFDKRKHLFDAVTKVVNDVLLEMPAWGTVAQAQQRAGHALLVACGVMSKVDDTNQS